MRTQCVISFKNLSSQSNTRILDSEATLNTAYIKCASSKSSKFALRSFFEISKTLIASEKRITNTSRLFREPSTQLWTVETPQEKCLGSALIKRFTKYKISTIKIYKNSRNQKTLISQKISRPHHPPSTAVRRWNNTSTTQRCQSDGCGGLRMDQAKRTQTPESTQRTQKHTRRKEKGSPGGRDGTATHFPKTT